MSSHLNIENFIAGKSFIYYGLCSYYWLCTCWMFEGQQHSCEASSRKMCLAHLPVDKGYFLLWIFSWPNNKFHTFFSLYLPSFSYSIALNQSNPNLGFCSCFFLLEISETSDHHFLVFRCRKCSVCSKVYHGLGRKTTFKAPWI